jgi:predicted RNA binding protein YcfA (HicA-like mRNA interferase family)
MPAAVNRLEAMRTNPRADWTIGDVQAVCREYGIGCEPARGGGSHYKVNHPRLNGALTIPFKRPIKPVYITKLVKLIDTLRHAQ